MSSVRLTPMLNYRPRHQLAHVLIGKVLVPLQRAHYYIAKAKAWQPWAVQQPVSFIFSRTVVECHVTLGIVRYNKRYKRSRAHFRHFLVYTCIWLPTLPELDVTHRDNNTCNCLSSVYCKTTGKKQYVDTIKWRRQLHSLRNQQSRKPQHEALDYKWYAI